MISSTFLAIFFVPAFYVAIQSLIELINGPPKPHPDSSAPVVSLDHAPPAAETLPLARRAKPDTAPPSPPPTATVHSDHSNGATVLPLARVPEPPTVVEDAPPKARPPAEPSGT
jgi:HAE1 family hydrophobic/amphiphilic exporter-1